MDFVPVPRFELSAVFDYILWATVNICLHSVSGNVLDSDPGSDSNYKMFILCHFHMVLYVFYHILIELR